MASDQKKAIGRRIAELREAKRWTQAELAERIGDPKVDAQYVSKWERGVYTPSKHLEALATALGVSEGDVLAGSDNGERAHGPDLMDALNGASEDRLERIERKLDRVLAALSIAPGEESEPSRHRPEDLIGPDRDTGGGRAASS